VVTSDIRMAGIRSFPQFPELNKFLNFWVEKLDGSLHSVTVAHARLIKPAELNTINGEFRLH